VPIVCINRPNRRKPRRYSEKDAGRIVCRVVSQGGDRDKLIAEISKCIDLCDKERIRNKVNELLQAIVALSILLGALLGITGALAAILLRIPLGYLLIPLLRRILPDPTKAIQKGIEIEGIAKEILELLAKPK
jgi:hypothetical protein